MQILVLQTLPTQKEGMADIAKWSLGQDACNST